MLDTLCAHNMHIDRVLYMYILSSSFFQENPSMVANSCTGFASVVVGLGVAEIPSMRQYLPQDV